MNRTAMNAAAAAFSLMTVTEAVAAPPEGVFTPGDLNAADQCVFNGFNEVAQALSNVTTEFPQIQSKFTLDYERKQLDAIARECGLESWDDVEVFQGIDGLQIDNTKFNFNL